MTLVMDRIDRAVRRVDGVLDSIGIYRYAVMYRVHVSALFLAMLIVEFYPKAHEFGYFPVLAYYCWHQALYIFNRYTDRNEDLRNAPRESTVGVHAKASFWLTWCLFAAGLILLFLYGEGVGLYVVSFPLALFYGLKFPWFSRRVKDITFLKTVYAVVVCWCLPIVLVNATYSSEIRLESSSLGFLLLVFFYTTCYELLADIKDQKGDAASGVSTMAVRFGVASVKITVLLVLFMAWLTSNIFYSFFSYSFALLILASLLFVHPDRSPLFFHGLIWSTLCAVLVFYFLNVHPRVAPLIH